MTAKEYLSQYYWAKKDIESMREEIQQLEAMAEYVSPRGSTGGSSGVSDKVGRTAAKLVDKKKKLDSLVGKTLALMNEIEVRIDQIDNVRYRWVLKERYVHCRKWTHIAQRGFYALRTVQYNNQKALAAFESRFPEIQLLSKD